MKSLNVVLMNRDTCRNCNIPAEDIVKIEELVDNEIERAYPYSRIFLEDKKQGHKYFVDVVESKKKIDEKIKEARKNMKETKTEEEENSNEFSE